MSIVTESMHRIRHKVQFATHKNSSQSHCCTGRNKRWSSHFPFPRRPCALIICQSDRCFSNDGVSCVLNFYQSPAVRDSIHHLMVETSTDSIPAVAFVTQQGGCCYQGGPLRWRQHFGPGLDFTAAAAQTSTSSHICSLELDLQSVVNWFWWLQQLLFTARRHKC